MKVHSDLKELLLDFSKYHWDETEPFNRPDHDKLVENYLSNNSLALGKPEPLAKTKQTQEYCECLMPPVQVNGSWYECRDCKKQIR